MECFLEYTPNSGIVYCKRQKYKYSGDLCSNPLRKPKMKLGKSLATEMSIRRSVLTHKVVRRYRNQISIHFHHELVYWMVNDLRDQLWLSIPYFAPRNKSMKLGKSLSSKFIDLKVQKYNEMMDVLWQQLKFTSISLGPIFPPVFIRLWTKLQEQLRDETR